jgi:dipeptidyl aminopeptidase/acylaminoacyl peptidase
MTRRFESLRRFAVRMCCPVLACVVAHGPCMAQLPAAPALEVYGRLPNLESVALSPDGSRLAFVRTVDDLRVVAIVGLDDGKLIGSIDLGDLKMRQIEWADDTHLMIVTSVTALPWGPGDERSEWRRLVVYDTATRKERLVPEPSEHLPMVVMPLIWDEPVVRRPGGHAVLFVPSIQVGRKATPVLVRLDLKTGDESIVERGSMKARGWFVDSTGRVAAEQDYDEQSQRWTILVREPTGAAWRAAQSGTAPIEYPKLDGPGPEADTVMVALPEGGPSWQRMSLSSGKFSAAPEVLADAVTTFVDPVTRLMVGACDASGRGRFVDAALQARWDAIAAQFADSRVHLVSAAGGFGRVVLLVDGPRDGYGYWLGDLQAGTVRFIGDVYPGIKKPFEARKLYYSAADGLKIPAVLTLPRGREPRRLPLVVLVHGGPASLDTPDFDWWSQALAAQGYAVLQSNFRGSAVDGAFLAAGYGQWGRKMQTDLSDGVSALAAQGVIDPARVCIVGASYGGYAALAGVTLQHGIYRCAVSVSGVSDPARMLAWVGVRRVGPASNVSQRYWDRFMGVEGPDDPRLVEISPVAHAATADAPVLLIHGKDDTVVPFEQSELMADALGHAHKQVEFVTLANEDHWLSHSATRLQMLQAAVGFLRARNPAD